MLDITNPEVKQRLLSGNFGLERESIRVLSDGSFSHTPHPFPGDEHITRDFCENQIEINTGVHDTISGALEELEYHNRRIYGKLRSMPEREYLWLFSNPPYIRSEDDIPIAVFDGAQSSKSAYRKYLSDKYGRYRMTFSGIHVNFSFADELLEADYEGKGRPGSFRDYRDRLYLDLAQRLVAYSWLLVSVTAASPLLDSSFVEKGVYDRDVFTGTASVRCSEMGYWNDFAPIFDYSDLGSYAESIRRYVNRGFLKAPSELYYPIRLKPPGENNLETLEREGINHIELRMFDLNPLAGCGVDRRDVCFAHLMMVWLAATPKRPMDDKDQVQAVQNFKNASHFDLKTVKILTPGGVNRPVADEALNVISMMRGFFGDDNAEIKEVLDFENEKFTNPRTRYAWRLRRELGGGFVKNALKMVKERQD